MDVRESGKTVEKQFTAETTRKTVLADDKNGTTRRSQTREVSSRYRSPTPSAAGAPKRCPSPNANRKSSTAPVSVYKRAISAERKRPSTPSPQPSPSPSTPVQTTTKEMLLASKRTVSNRLPESLWPSTMRSLSSSFQSDTISFPVGNGENTVSDMPTDRTRRPSASIASKGERVPSRKSTPERKRSPLKGKNSADQLENSKPIDSSNSCLLDQHRRPSRISGKMSIALNKSETTDKMDKTSFLSHSRTSKLFPRRLSLDGAITSLKKSSSDFLMPISRDNSGKEMLHRGKVDDDSLRICRPGSSSSSDGMSSAAARTQSSPILRPRLPSPSLSRGVSPSRSRAAISSSRGTSPARSTPPSPSRQPQNSTSVLSFVVDIKKGKKDANIEDVHQLRLLYNRHLQWRYVNAQTDAALRSKRVKAEKTFCSVWSMILDMMDSMRKKRSDLQQLWHKLKLYSILNNQVTCLNEWALIERDHIDHLTLAIQDLQASTIRIPVTGGAKGDIKTVKAAVCSAVDLMQATGSSLSSTLSLVEKMNYLISELADVAAHERAMLEECESLLGSTAALQLEERSLGTNLIQMKHYWRKDDPSTLGN